MSLAPSATNILESIGARRYLVGVSKWCKDVADVKRLPIVGDCWTLEPAEVMALRPTLVIGSVPFKAETVGKLLERPVTFLAKNPRTLEDIYNDITLLGAITHREAAAQKTIQTMQRDFAALARQARRFRSKPRVYCEAWSNPRISSPPWVAELTRIAGGRFAVPAGQRVTDEQVAAAKPHVIVLAWAAVGAKSKSETALANPTWQAVPAVRNQRVRVIRDELLNTPAPILTKGARALFDAIHN